MEYVLTGPESLSQYEQIATICRAIGRALQIEEVSPEEARRGCMKTMRRRSRTFAGRVGRGGRSTGVRHIDGPGTPGKRGADLLRMGHGERGGVYGRASRTFAESSTHAASSMKIAEGR
jgi:hypothetical protein